MFSSRRNIYTRKKTSRKRVSLRWMLLWLPALLLAVLLVSEGLLRLVVAIIGQPEHLARDQDQSPVSQAYQLQFLTDNQPIQGLPDGGNLKMERSPVAGYQLVPNQESEFWQINEQGWRDNRAISPDKPDNEIRIFLIGGSTAFGYQNQSNQDTIAQKLEERLNKRVEDQQQNSDDYQPEVLPYFQPTREKLMDKPPCIEEKDYRVINASVPGYASGNQLSQLAVEILPYNPDLIIVLGGYQDLMLESKQSYSDIPSIDNYLNHPVDHFKAYLYKPINGFTNQLYLNRVFRKPNHQTAQNTLLLKQHSNDSLAAYLPEPSQEEELTARVQRYRNNHLQMVRLAAGANIPVISALQPEITGYESLSEGEQAIIDELDDDYRQNIQQAYQELGNANAQLEQIFPNNVASVNLYNSINEGENADNQSLFVDPIHLSATGNSRVANHLYQSLIPEFKITPREPS